MRSPTSIRIAVLRKNISTTSSVDRQRIKMVLEREITMTEFEVRFAVVKEGELHPNILIPHVVYTLSLSRVRISENRCQLNSLNGLFNFFT